MKRLLLAVTCLCATFAYGIRVYRAAGIGESVGLIDGVGLAISEAIERSMRITLALAFGAGISSAVLVGKWKVGALVALGLLFIVACFGRP